MSARASQHDRLPRELPLVGRSRQLERLYTIFGSTPGTPPLHLLHGESGVGKSRLAITLAREAERRDWTVVRGRAYPVEKGVPYALMADAFVPFFREMDDSSLTVLSRGREGDLRRLFPTLGGADDTRPNGLDPEELRTRLFWTFHTVLENSATRTPLLVVLEDLHWADASSLALLHFVVRQLGDAPVRIVATVTSADRSANAGLVELERSLAALNRIAHQKLDALEIGHLEELVQAVFGMEGPPVTEFTGRLYAWTRGNPYFVEQTLQSLVQDGRLHVKDGTWLGWDSREMDLPSTVRDALLIRFDGLAPLARETAHLMAASGRPTPLVVLENALDHTAETVGEAVEQLLSRGLVEETEDDDALLLRFNHPLTRETLYRSLSRVRRRVLHRKLTAALESYHGPRVLEHADELAFHLSQAGTDDADPRTIEYLVAAARSALDRHADDEAADYLTTALHLSRRAAGGGSHSGHEATLLHLLLRAQTRRGAFAEANDICAVLLTAAAEAGDDVTRARLLRHRGLLAYWEGHQTEAVRHLDAALEAAPVAEARLQAQVQLAAATALQQLGKPKEARERIRVGLERAETVDDPGLIGRLHRALALVSTWIGETDTARENAHRALEIGTEHGDETLVFWGRWALASLEGLVGGPAPMREWIDLAREAARGIGSPVLDLFVDELELEYLYFLGRWDAALALGARATERARALNQTGLLVRMLTWTSCIYSGRGDHAEADRLVSEAESLTGMADPDGDRSSDVHAVVPALIGRTHYLLAQDRAQEALETGRRALQIAEESGYVIWVLHRLLPMVGEAHVRLRDLAGAEEIRQRLVREGERMDHRLSLMWATACQALITWWSSGDMGEVVRLLGEAADDMEKMGVAYDAARLRRQLAGRYAELGHTDRALLELRRVHDVFEDLGAEPELDKARVMFTEIDTAPPAAVASRDDPDALSDREYDVAALVADRLSNKRIGRELGIAEATVARHLYNIYRRLDLDGSGIQKRLTLGDMVREGRLRRPSG